MFVYFWLRLSSGRVLCMLIVHTKSFNVSLHSKRILTVSMTEFFCPLKYVWLSDSTPIVLFPLRFLHRPPSHLSKPLTYPKRVYVRVYFGDCKKGVDFEESLNHLIDGSDHRVDTRSVFNWSLRPYRILFRPKAPKFTDFSSSSWLTLLSHVVPIWSC